MPIEYLESEDTLSVTGDGKTVPKVDGGYWEVVKKQVIDLEATITLYIGSPAELANAIAGKQGEILAEFRAREGMSLEAANALVDATINAAATYTTKFNDNTGKADVAIIFVGALPDVATVQAYDAATDPSWIL